MSRRHVTSASKEAAYTTTDFENYIDTTKSWNKSSDFAADFQLEL